MDGVLEFVFVFVYLLGPLALVFSAKDPVGVVFGFYDEDAVGGDDEVVDLGGAGAIGSGEVEVVEEFVFFRVEFF